MNDGPLRDSNAYPAEFVSKLYRMLENPEYKGIVCWSDPKDSFIILNISAFQEKIIPREFSHANFSSFVRQLNKYDFHKQRFNDSNSRVWEFKHKDFRYSNRDRPHLIKRKPPSSRNQAFQGSVEELQSILAEVQGRLEKLEAENTNMYRVIEKQDRIINMLVESATGSPSGNHPQDPHARDSPQSRAVSTSSGTNLNTPPDGPPGTPGVPRTTAKPSSTAAPPQPSSAQSAEQPHIVVAMTDDNARNITSNLLRDYGCVVDSTDSGAELVRLVEINSYRAIVLEPVLTALDGISAATMIRRLSLSINIIFCVDKDQADVGFTEAYYQSRGVSTVLWRPFTKQDLYNALIAYL